MLLVLLSGMLFYQAVEGWRWLDALYFSVMTLTTIGYGDLHPTTDFSKIFTMIYALVGMGLFVAFATQLAQALVRKARSDTGNDDAGNSGTRISEDTGTD